MYVNCVTFLVYTYYILFLYYCSTGVNPNCLSKILNYIKFNLNWYVY